MLLLLHFTLWLLRQSQVFLAEMSTAVQLPNFGLSNYFSLISVSKRKKIILEIKQIIVMNRKRCANTYN